MGDRYLIFFGRSPPVGRTRRRGASLNRDDSMDESRPEDNQAILAALDAISAKLDKMALKSDFDEFKHSMVSQTQTLSHHTSKLNETCMLFICLFVN